MLLHAALASGLLVACRAKERAQIPTRAPEAEAALDAFLKDASMLSPGVIPDSLSACEVYGSGSYQLALVKHRVLDSERQGDSATVRAEVTAVARVDLATDGPYEVREAITIDTLQWSVRHVPSSQRWAVCGFARDGAGFVRLDYLGEDTRWLRGTSMNRLRHLADSIAGQH
jgi:hypothetical protein